MKCPKCGGEGVYPESVFAPNGDVNGYCCSCDWEGVYVPPAVRRAFAACKRQIKAGRAYAIALHAHQAMRKDLTDDEQSTILRAADRAGCADTRALRAIARAEGKGKEKA